MAKGSKKSRKAKKAKKAQGTKQRTITDQEIWEIEEHFHRVRNQLLCQWYEQAHVGGQYLKAAAQARLQLQIWLRDHRREVITLKGLRDAFKAEGNGIEARNAREKLKKAEHATAMLNMMVRTGIPTATALTACQQWARMTLPLEFVLADQYLDKKVDFGINHESLLIPIANSVSNSLITLQTSLETMELEDRDCEMALEDKEKVFDPDEPILDSNSIWAQHVRHIQRRYRFSELPDFAVDTRLAFQKKLFEVHVDREHQLIRAAENTPKSSTNCSHPLRPRQGVYLSWNSMLCITIASEHSIWELTSPLLWHHFEDGLSWDYPQWIPKGVMRIRTISNESSIYFDFGMHSFSTVEVFMTANVSTSPLVCKTKCYQTGGEFEIQITFLVNGFAQVDFPALAIITSDVGCMHLPLTIIRLTGMWMSSCG